MKWEICQLENGIQLLAGQDEEAAGFSLGFYIPRGSAGEPEDRHGLCCLWMEMLLEKLNAEREGPLWRGRADWEYTALIAEGKETPVQLAEAFFQCAAAPGWTEKELDAARKRLARQNKQLPPENFRELMETEYWRESIYNRPVCGTEEELSSLSLKQVQKWHQSAIEGGKLLCVITGQPGPGELRALESVLGAQKTAVVREKKKKKSLPREFAKRQTLTGWIADTESGPSQALISFDIPSPSGLFAAAGFCQLLNAAKTPEALRILKEDLKELEGFSCTMESHAEASRLLLSFSVPSEELVPGLRRCFSAIASLKQGMGEKELAELVHLLVKGRSGLWKDPAKVNLHMGRYFCVAPQACMEFLSRNGMLSPEELRQAAEEIFQPENLTIAVSCQPGLVKRKKLQKVMMEARILLQGPQATVEEETEVRKKLFRQFIRDCQAETDVILAGADRSVYQLWKKYQCYIRLRKADDAHYSFESVQEFLLGHGYSKDDVKRLKKRKDREKEDRRKKEEPQDDWKRIVEWFFEDTRVLIEALAEGEPWQGAPAAAVKRSNLCMRYQGRRERGLDAVMAMLDGKETDLTRIKAYLAEKNAGK